MAFFQTNLRWFQKWTSQKWCEHRQNPHRKYRFRNASIVRLYFGELYTLSPIGTKICAKFCARFYIIKLNKSNSIYGFEFVPSSSCVAAVASFYYDYDCCEAYASMKTVLFSTLLQPLWKFVSFKVEHTIVCVQLSFY